MMHPRILGNTRIVSGNDDGPASCTLLREQLEKLGVSEEQIEKIEGQVPKSSSQGGAKNKKQ